MKIRSLLSYLPRKARASLGSITCGKRYGGSIVVMVDGGLASQVWKIVFGEWIAARLGCKVFYDTTWFREVGKDIKGIENRKLAVRETFPAVSMMEAGEGMIRDLRRYRRYSNPWPHVAIAPKAKDLPVYYDGYYMNSMYFESQKTKVRQLLKFSERLADSERARRLRAEIGGTYRPIAVHVRRGDYVGTIHEAVSPEYFSRAIGELERRGKIVDGCKIFFFTNDGGYVEREIVPRLAPKADYLVVEGDDSDGPIDMSLMSLCRDFVISNSGFSWIPAWLSDDPAKVVIMPSKWYGAENERTVGGDSAFMFPGAIQI